MGDAQSSPILDRAYATFKEDIASKAPKTHPATLASTKQTSFAWRAGRRARICTHPSPASTESGSSPTDETSDSIMGKLSQEQIQHNYAEFEKRKKDKAAEKAYYMATIPGFDGVVSPTDVVGDKCFERIFRGEDEDGAGEWVSEVESGEGSEDGDRGVRVCFEV